MLAVREIPQGTSVFEMGEHAGRMKPEYVKLSEADLVEAQIHENVKRYLKDVIVPDRRDGAASTFDVPLYGLNGLHFSFFVNATHCEAMANVKYHETKFDASGYRQIVTTRRVRKDEEILFYTERDPASEGAAAYSDSAPVLMGDEVENLMRKHSRLSKTLERMKENAVKVEGDLESTMQKIMDAMKPPENPQYITAWHQSEYGYPVPGGRDTGKTGLVFMEEDDSFTSCQLVNYVSADERGQGHTRGMYKFEFPLDRDGDYDVDYCSEGDETMLMWRVISLSLLHASSSAPLLSAIHTHTHTHTHTHRHTQRQTHNKTHATQNQITMPL